MAEYHNLNHFINREPEIENFDRLLADPQRRIFLLYGDAGMGKSGLLHILRRDHTHPTLRAIFVDFRARRTLGGESGELIHFLGKKLGPEVADALPPIPDETESLQWDPADLARLEASIVSIAETVAAARTTSGGGMAVQGNVTVQDGDAVGRDKIVINLPSLLAHSGGWRWKQRQRQEQALTEAFQTALRGSSDEQPVILYFDHCEEAEGVATWLEEELLGLLLDPAEAATNLWVVCVGRQVPLQPQAGTLREILRSQEVRPLSKEATILYWEKKRGLPTEESEHVFRFSGGKPNVLKSMADTIEEDIEDSVENGEGEVEADSVGDAVPQEDADG